MDVLIKDTTTDVCSHLRDNEIRSTPHTILRNESSMDQRKGKGTRTRKSSDKNWDNSSMASG